MIVSQPDDPRVHFGSADLHRGRRKEEKSMSRMLIAKFYRAADGSQSVDDFIATQNVQVQLAIDRQIERINGLDETNPHLAFPYSSQIEGELRELRAHYGNTLFRILYRRSKQFIVLLHIFEKRSGSVPEAEKQVARQRWNDFRKRIDAKPRKQPAPIGRKAPPPNRL